ncbi:uncharacterized protein LOC143510742 [Brachyhypopomus gauderio]|uniref:uncharacterized protein LOC143510742 n=1 Tax=Brachyhypopomus gauderio TaxID=698409 RepID=UPI004041FF09
MDYTPTFRREACGELTLQPSPDAAVLVSAYKQRPTSSRPWNADRVRDEAKGRVKAGGGDPGNARLVLSESTVQFGQYRGQTFRWLLTHDVGYAMMVSAAHQREREGGDASVSPSMANKDVLVRYVSLFPDVTRAVRERCVMDEPSSSGQEGQCLVWFGEHQSVSYRDLYQAQDREKRSYVQWIQQQKVRPGTKMEALQKFIQCRDVEKITRPETRSVPAPDTVPRLPGLSKRRTSTASRSTQDPTDAELLAASVELDVEGELSCRLD